MVFRLSVYGSVRFTVDDNWKFNDQKVKTIIPQRKLQVK